MASGELAALIPAPLPHAPTIVNIGLAVLGLGVLDQRLGARKVSVARRAVGHWLVDRTRVETIGRDNVNEG